MNIHAWNGCMGRFYFWIGVAVYKPDKAWAHKVAMHWYKKANGYMIR